MMLVIQRKVDICFCIPMGEDLGMSGQKCQIFSSDSLGHVDLF